MARIWLDDMRQGLPNPTAEEIELQADIIKAYLVRESEAWLGARALADRALGLDSNLNEKAAKHYRMIDQMLLELIEVPGVRYEC